MSKTAIVIVGGGLVKDASGRWRTTGFSEGDNFGVMGDRLRVLAGAYAFKDTPDAQMLTLGGRGQLEGAGSPAISEVIKEELSELGVPAEQILIEIESENTYQQLMALKKFMADASYDEIRVITNRYHIPRVRAMLGTDVELQKAFHDGMLRLESAEEILVEHDPSWEGPIREAYESEVMQERIRKEEEGVRQIKEGRYKLR